MAVARLITARVVPITTAKELTAALATALSGDAGIGTAVVVTAGQAANAAGTDTTKIGKGFSHIYVFTDKENLAATAKTNLDAALAARGLGYSGVSGAISPLLEHNDADNAVSISRAAGATTVRYTATLVSGVANGLIWTLDTGGILASSITVADISAGVKDYAIDLAGGDAAGPYTVVVTVTDPNTNLSASADLVVTSTA